jgi:8-oxo-dGTP diphosphatase
MIPVDDDLRAEIGKVIAAITPFDDAEQVARRSVLDWVESGAPLFRQHGSTPPKHLAVFFAFLDTATNTVMQVHHVKAGAWLFPGGHVDAESPWKSVLREAEEELAVQANFHPIVGDVPLFVTESITRGPDSHTDVTLWFVLQGQRDMPIEPDEREFTAIRWVGLSDVQAWKDDCHAPQQVERFIAKLTATVEGACVPA